MATSTQDTVNSLYKGLLGRASDKEGADYWSKQIDSGKMTTDQVRQKFGEYRKQYGGEIDKINASKGGSASGQDYVDAFGSSPTLKPKPAPKPAPTTKPAPKPKPAPNMANPNQYSPAQEIAPGPQANQATSKGYDANGYDAQGFDANGYDAQGFDANGYDARGYDANNYDAQGYDTQGFDAQSYDANGYDAQGYDTQGYDSRGYTTDNYSAQTGNAARVIEIGRAHV